MNYPFYPTFHSRPFLARRFHPAGNPFRVDIDEDDKAYRIVADLPGISKKDVAVELDKNVLTVSAQYGNGEGEAAAEGDSKTSALRRERFCGEYTRRFSLPDGIDADNINADIKNGVLTLSIPKSEAAAARKIAVK